MSFYFTNKQSETFDDIMYARFYKKILPIIRDCFEDKIGTMTEKDILERIRKDHKTADKFEIKTERGITRFICLGFMLEHNFYTRPEFKELFGYKDLDKDECIDLIFEEGIRISKNEEPITFFLTPINKNYKVKNIVQKIALLIQ
jgi:hypothetical protein